MQKYKAWFSYAADLPGTWLPERPGTTAAYVNICRWHIICPRHWPPACLRSWAEFNFAGKPATNAGDKLCVGDKCSHMPQRCPRPCRRPCPRSVGGIWEPDLTIHMTSTRRDSATRPRGTVLVHGVTWSKWPCIGCKRVGKLTTVLKQHMLRGT